MTNPIHHMKPYTYTNSKGESFDEPYYNGPTYWVHEGIACAITWDDMWLVQREVVHMIQGIGELEVVKLQGAQWQNMRIVWRDDIEHYVMEVPLYEKYGTKEEKNG